MKRALTSQIHVTIADEIISKWLSSEGVDIITQKGLQIVHGHEFRIFPKVISTYWKPTDIRILNQLGVLI